MIFKGLVLLPYSFQLFLGRCLGRVLVLVPSRRRHIAQVNLKKCFPELMAKDLKKLLVKNFESLGQGFFETLMAWFISERRLQKIPFKIIGLENLEAAEAQGRGILMISGHFDCMELVGRFTGGFRQLSFVYRPLNKPDLNDVMHRGRSAYGKLIETKNLRGMIASLRAGETLWYAPDQDFGAKRSVFAPFFNIPTATLKATAELAQAGRALCVPAFCNRSKTGHGYEIHFLKALENFPSGDDLADATLYNHYLEAHIRQFPEQYFWVHRRFKTRPDSQINFYH